MASGQTETNLTEKTSIEDNDTFLVWDSSDLDGAEKKLKKVKRSNMTENTTNVVFRIFAYNNLV